MSPIYGSSFESYLVRLTDIFRRRVAENWMVLALGWVLQTGRKTTAGLIRAAGGIASKRFAAYYRFFRTDSWSPEVFWKTIQQMVFERIDSGPIFVGVDDTLWQKVGRSIEGCGWYPSKKSLYHRSLTYVFGQCWVVLTVQMEVPFAEDAIISLPVMARLYKPKEDCDNGEFRTRLEMVHEMLEILAETASDQRIIAVADSFYGGKPLLGDLPESVGVIVRLKRDRQLYEIPTRPEQPGPGRPRKKGDQLKQPKDWIQESTGWGQQVVQRYGENETVQLQTQKALWYSVTRDQPGRVVMVKDEDQDTGLALYSTDPNLSAEAIIQLYSKRWKTEIVFREAKQVGGAEDPQVSNPRGGPSTDPVQPGIDDLGETVVCGSLR